MASSTSQAMGGRVARALSVAGTGGEAGQGVLREVARGCGAPLAVLWLLDERAGLLRWSDDWSDRAELDVFREVCRRLTFAEGVGLPGAVLATGEPGFVEDVATEPRFPRAEAAARAGLRCAVAAPLVAREGALGVLELLATDRDPRLADRVGDVATSARQLAGYLGRVHVEERLRASEESSASIFRAALDAVITMDHEGRIVDFNPAAEATFGYDSEAVAGDVLAERIIPPELRDAHHRALTTYMERREGTVLNRRLEVPAMRADGSTFPAELTVTRLGTSEPPLFAGFIRDITDRHRVEAERDRLLAEAVSARARAEAAEQRAAAARAAAEAARAEAEAAGIRVALLARASERMLAIRDYEEAPQRVVDAVVPALADWCAVAVRRDPRAPGPQAAAHRDPARAPLVRELSRRGWPGDAPRAGAVPSAGPGARELIEPVSDDDLRRLARDDRDLELLRALAPRAVLTVPLLTPGRLSGTITFAMAESGRGFEAEDLPFAASLAARIALALENARLLAEQSHIADTLQRSLLPPRLPAIPGLDLAARYRAAGEGNLVGGDFYDVFRSGDGVWTAILGDVAGKGPEAAAATALTRHTLRAAGLRASSPVDGLRLLNEALLAGAGGTVSRFASVVYTRLCSSDDGALATIGVGGHPPPLILRAGGGLEYADVRGTLLGAVAEIEVAEVDVRLAAGDTLLFYTDGVTEVRTSDPGYGERLMERTLREHADASAEVIVAAVERAAVEAQDGEPRDDIALIAVRVRAR